MDVRNETTLFGACRQRPYRGGVQASPTRGHSTGGMIPKKRPLPAVDHLDGPPFVLHCRRRCHLTTQRGYNVERNTPVLWSWSWRKMPTKHCVQEKAPTNQITIDCYHHRSMKNTGKRPMPAFGHEVCGGHVYNQAWCFSTENNKGARKKEIVLARYVHRLCSSQRSTCLHVVVRLSLARRRRCGFFVSTTAKNIQHTRSKEHDRGSCIETRMIDRVRAPPGVSLIDRDSVKELILIKDEINSCLSTRSRMTSCVPRFLAKNEMQQDIRVGRLGR